MAQTSTTTKKKAARAALKLFDGSAHGGALSGFVDRYNGIRIAEDKISPTTSVEDFRSQLTKTVAVYKDNGFRGVWLKLKKDQAHLAGVAVQDAGFSFHHAKDDYLMMTQWLPNTLNKMPGFASHYVGVGGLVLNSDRSKMLCIQEQKPPTEFGRLWKLPGGLVEAGESMEQAAIREVWEETGVKTKFVSLVGFRELLKYQWGQQDLYFVCLLEPVDGNEKIDIQMPDEIFAADWIPLADMAHFRFTNMARNTCRILSSYDALKKGAIDLKQMPLDDVFKDCTFTGEEYEVAGTTNKFFSSQHMKRVGDFIKNSQSKL